MTFMCVNNLGVIFHFLTESDCKPIIDCSQHMGYYSSGSPRRSTVREYSPMRREPPNRCSLLVRNLSRDVRAEDLRRHAEQYGPVRDVYIPTDYYSREPRGIGFIEYTHPRDAEDGKFGLDRMVIHGREIQVVFAQRGRKRPEDFRRGGGGRRYGGGYNIGGGGGYGRYSPPRRSLRRPRSYSRSPVRRRRYSYSRSPSPKRTYRRSYSRSPTPKRREDYSRSYSPRDKSYERDARRAADEDRNPRTEEEERYEEKHRYKDDEERQHDREDKMRDRYNEEDELQTDRYEQGYAEEDKGEDMEENGISPQDKQIM